MAKTMAVLTVWGVIALAAIQADALDIGIPKLAVPPAINGNLADWKSVPDLEIADKTADRAKSRVDHARIGWDDANLYLGVRVKDHAIVNDRPLATVGDADCVKLLLGAPDGKGQTRVLVIAPASQDGAPALVLRGGTADVTTTQSPDPSGIQWALGKDAEGWTVEAAVPLALVGADASGHCTLPFVLQVYDRDRADVDEWKQKSWSSRSETFSHKKPVAEWPRLVLGTPQTVAEPSVEAKREPLTVEFSSATPFFVPGQAVAYDVTVRNGGVSGQGTFAAEVVDLQGHSLAKQDVEFRRDLGLATRFDLDLGPLPKGLYYLKYTASVQCGVERASETASVQPFAVMDAEPGKTTDPAAFAELRWDNSQAGREIDLSQFRKTFNDDFKKMDVVPEDQEPGPDAVWFAPGHGAFRGNSPFSTGPDGAFELVPEGLRLRVRDIGNGRWRGACMTSVNTRGQGFAQLYGYFEATIRYDYAGDGIWGAFWAKSQQDYFTGGAATRTEVDFNEFYGDDGFHPTPHLWPAAKPRPGETILKHLYASGFAQKVARWFFKPLKDEGGGVVKGFHQYGGEITPEWIIIYFDRKEVGRFPMVEEWKTPLFLLVNVILTDKGAPNAKLPIDMVVNNVSAYQPVTPYPGQ